MRKSSVLLLLLLLLQLLLEKRPAVGAVICFPDQSIEECVAARKKQQTSRPNEDLTVPDGCAGDPAEASQCMKSAEDSAEATEPAETEEEEQEVAPRSLLLGRSCVASEGYLGICRPPQDCKGVNYSYSRTCGWSYSCCQQKSPQQPVTQRPVVATTPSTTPPAAAAVGSLLDEGCGRVAQNFVFGGELAEKGAFPYIVSFVNVFGKEVENFCGGVLITRQHVLTAAHCFSNIKESIIKAGKIDVRIGMVDLSAAEDWLAQANIQKVTIHPDYRERGTAEVNPTNDIAIVKLDRQIESDKVTVVCLPSQPKSNTWTVVAGFGRTTKEKFDKTDGRLRFAYVEEHTPTACQEKYNNFLLGKSISVRISDAMLCAGNDKADACAGDSGGPLLWTESRRWTVGGVVSFGPSSCGNVAPGVYTRVDRYLAWIKKTVEED